MNESEKYASEIVEYGRSLFERGLTPGRTGNLSVRVGSRVLITPTNTSLGRLDPDRLSVTDLDGKLLRGDKPSKELSLHLAMYKVREDLTAIAHLHSPYAVAVASLAAVDADDALPPLTPYYIMRVGHLPVAPYAEPGSELLSAQVSDIARTADAILLSNHGSISGGPSLEAAVDAVEEIEATARIYLLTQGLSTRPLPPSAVAELQSRKRNP